MKLHVYEIILIPYGNINSYGSVDVSLTLTCPYRIKKSVIIAKHVSLCLLSVNYIKGWLHDATLRAILHAMGKLHRMATIGIVACNIARNISEVESNSTSAALRATISLNFIVCPLPTTLREM